MRRARGEEDKVSIPHCGTCGVSVFDAPLYNTGDGFWACEEHTQKLPKPEVKELVDLIREVNHENHDTGLA